MATPRPCLSTQPRSSMVYLRAGLLSMADQLVTAVTWLLLSCQLLLDGKCICLLANASESRNGVAEKSRCAWSGSLLPLSARKRQGRFSSCIPDDDGNVAEQTRRPFAWKKLVCPWDIMPLVRVMETLLWKGGEPKNAERILNSS